MHVELQSAPTQTVFSIISHFRRLDGESRFWPAGWLLRCAIELLTSRYAIRPEPVLFARQGRSNLSYKNENFQNTRRQRGGFLRCIPLQ